MISVKIEKELKGENKIVAGLTFRQALCGGVALLIITLIYIFLKPTQDVLVPIGILFGGGAWYLGWHTKNGLHSEYFLIKKIKESVLMNTQRKYRTKNQYITLMNNAYIKDRNADLIDSKTKKLVKKRDSQIAKKKKKSRVKSYM